MLHDGRILMIGQYRYPHGIARTGSSPPAASRPASCPETAAIASSSRRPATGRELARALPGFYPTNGISAHYAHAFVAHGCQRAGVQQLEPSERILLRAFERGEVEALLDAGRILDAFAALPLLYYLRSRR